MDGSADGSPVGRRLSVGTVLVVALLVFAVGTAAWVVGQFTAEGRAPAAFRERTALPRCAPIEVPQGRAVPAALQDCLLRPESRRVGAEVRVTSVTSEGDPILTYYRVLPGGGVEVFTDATSDSYGPGEWSHTRCPDVEALQEWDRCQPA